MAVRFLPSPDGETKPSGEDRANLAEVIELRSLLQRNSGRATAEGSESESDEALDPAQASVSTQALGSTQDPDSAQEPESTPPSEPVQSSRLLRAVPAVSVGAEVLRGVFPAAQMLQAAIVNPPAADPAASTAPAALASAAQASAIPAPVASPLPEETSGPERSANEDGVRLLARKAKSSGELRQELLRLEHDPSEVEMVIAEFEQSLYLDDLGLARFLTEKLRDSKRASKSQIRVKLRERKLGDSAIDTALDELDDEEEISLLRQAAADRARSMRDLDRQTAERRLLGFLARRGWSGEQATRAVRDALDGNGRVSRGGSGGVRFR